MPHMCVSKVPEKTGGIQGEENGSKPVMRGWGWGQAFSALPSSRIEFLGI